MAKRIVVGLLAHVDAGKTTLSEAMLYRAGAIGSLGRVDHKNAFLDTFSAERARGITIFAHQAQLCLPQTALTLLDTPGHVDFSPEAERTLNALDCAVLVISGTDGVQAHTKTLWQLLARHQIPTLLFVNKMDLPAADRQAILAELQTTLSPNAVDFTADVAEGDLHEGIALCEERLLAQFLEGAPPTEAQTTALFAARRLFPVLFGAALQLEGVDRLLELIDRLPAKPIYAEDFGAQVIKVQQTEDGQRACLVKVTGGRLAVRQRIGEDKVTALRLYHGAKHQPISEAEAGQVVSVLGLSSVQAGDALGAAQRGQDSTLRPVLRYRLRLPDGVDAHEVYPALCRIAEQEPSLALSFAEGQNTLSAQVMGEVQLEILQELFAEQLGFAVEFDVGQVVYRETIASSALGIGHFEPLRHYAEVQVMLSPAPRGSGVQIESLCKTSLLSREWQRVVLSCLARKRHRGVLIGAPLTDVTITLVAGKAHLKHTEGGDFYEAASRAVRQALMQAEPVLLEPYYAYTLTLPQHCVGRAMHDLERMGSGFEAQQLAGEVMQLCGKAAVRLLRDYAREVAGYTGGEGRLSLAQAGFFPCTNAAQVLDESDYSPTAQSEDTPNSVFCSHGAGYVVPWYEVAAHAHIKDMLQSELQQIEQAAPPKRQQIDENELRVIFERTYGPVRDRGFEAFCQSRKKSRQIEQDFLSRVRAEDYLLVDGYNIIFAWEMLSNIAKDDLQSARAALQHRLSNFRSMRGCKLILVYDAYRVKGSAGSLSREHGLDIVFTREAETADMYIEQASYDLSRAHRVRVATSDAAEQMIILGHGAERISARELLYEVEQAERQLAEIISAQSP